VCFSGPPGFYSVRLITGNALGSDTMISFILIDSAVADIGVNDTLYQNLPSTFTDNSVSAVSWNWEFGDGNSTSFQNPFYTYSSVGNYTVTLIITNDNGCIDTATKDIVVIQFIGQEELNRLQAISVYPNPASTKIYVELGVPADKSTWLTIENTLGQVVYEGRDFSSSSSIIEVSIESLQSGVYYLNIGNNQGTTTKKFIRLDN